MKADGIENCALEDGRKAFLDVGFDRIHIRASSCMLAGFKNVLRHSFVIVPTLPPISSAKYAI